MNCIGACRLGIDHFTRICYWSHDDGFIVDKCFEVFSLRHLGVAVVEEFVQEFVEEDEVFANGFFGEGAAVVFEDFGNL